MSRSPPRPPRALIADVRARGEIRPARSGRASRRRAPGTRSVPTRPRSRPRSRRSTRACAPRLEEAIARVRARERGPGAAARGHPVRRRAPRSSQRWQPVGRVGFYVPGGKAVYPSSVVMNVVPAQVAGVGSVALASPRAGRVRRGRAPDDPRRGGPPRRRGGLRDGRRGRDRRARLRRPVARPRSGRRRHRARATSTSPPPSGSCAASSGIDAEAGPTEILVIADAAARRRARGRRPRQPGRARRAGGRRAGHRFARARRRRSSRSSNALAASTAPLGSRARRARRARSRRSCSSTTWRRPPSSANAYGPEHLEIQTAAPGAAARPDRERGRDLPRGVRAGEPRRLPRRLEPRAAHRRAGAILVGPRGGDLPAPAAGHPLRPRRHCARSPTASGRSRMPRSSPRTATPSMSASLPTRFDRIVTHLG